MVGTNFSVTDSDLWPPSIRQSGYLHGFHSTIQYPNRCRRSSIPWSLSLSPPACSSNHPGKSSFQMGAHGRPDVLFSDRLFFLSLHSGKRAQFSPGITHGSGFFRRRLLCLPGNRLSFLQFSCFAFCMPWPIAGAGSYGAKLSSKVQNVERGQSLPKN